MLVYIFIFFIVSLSYLTENYLSSPHTYFFRSQFRKNLNYIVILILVLVSGTREIGGTDYNFYQQSYENTPYISSLLTNYSQIHSSFYLSGMDFGYLLICSIFKSLGFSFHLFCLAEAFFFYIAMYVGLSKYCSNYSTILLVFLSKIFFYDTFISMRQSITVALFFLNIQNISDRNPIRYYINAFISVFIHAGSFVVFPLYFLNKITISSRKLKTIFAFFLPFLIFNIFGINILRYLAPLVTPLFGIISKSWQFKAFNYLVNSKNSLSIIYALEFMIIFGLILSNYDKLKSIGDRATLSIKLFMCLWPLYTAFSTISVITREKDYFILFYGILLAYIMKIDSRYKKLIEYALLVIAGFQFFRYIFVFDGGSLVNYSSWLF